MPSFSVPCIALVVYNKDKNTKIFQCKHVLYSKNNMLSLTNAAKGRDTEPTELTMTSQGSSSCK